ncbi:hypothetical protein [Roseateles terrae]|uniref:Uncharacterized protein n=1 Tax=Roseateles terrae TaxID=431060 RepID=A0ABR6GXU9_9BURK|nr:hypothetical protein [Roseateles terrae]MBB3196885.1 hypothetical protein [Roseateles terrae]OWQ84567.1 hypothetical protein CDN98_18850 [Roseateles terrae]
MRIFIDTEFIETTEGPCFISAAFLTDAGRQLYSEITVAEAEDLLRHHPNPFVADQVLPQLGRVPGVPWAEIGAHLLHWLDSLGADDVEIVYDYNVDFLLVEQLLASSDAPLAATMRAAHVGYLLDDLEGKAAAESAWHALEATHGIARHHALADAYALRARFEAVHRVAEPVEWRTVEVDATVTVVIPEFEIVHAETHDGALTLCIGEGTPNVDWRSLTVGQRLRCAVETGPATRVLSAEVLSQAGTEV